MFVVFNNRFRFAAQVSKERRTDDQADIFEKRKVKKQQGKPENNAGKSEQETQEAVLEFLDPIAHMQDIGDILNNGGSGFAEKVHGSKEQYRIDQSRYQYPFPKPVLNDKAMGQYPGLDRYDYFFEQTLILSGKYKETGWEVGD